MKIIPISKASAPFVLNITPLPAVEGEGLLPVDIVENEREILLIAPLAGVNLEETEIVILSDVLTLRGKRQRRLEEFGFKPSDLFQEECFWGEFSRSVVLPPQVEVNAIEATARDQVLYVRLPKRPNIKMRIVKIK